MGIRYDVQNYCGHYLNLWIRHNLFFFGLAYRLGNELSGAGYQARVQASQYAKDVIVLKSLVNRIYKGHHEKPLVIAPGGLYEENWFREFIDKTKPSSSLSVITHHIYSLGAGICHTLLYMDMIQEF